MEQPTDLNESRLQAAKKQAEGTKRMLEAWAQRQGIGILKQMEMKRHASTLSLHWGHIKNGWIGGFVSGVQAGFQLGYQTANKLSDSDLAKSSAVVSGTEVEAIENQNAEIRNLLGTAIGEASMCWVETPTGQFDSTRASKIVDSLMERFGTPVPAKAEDAAQMELPIGGK